MPAGYGWSFPARDELRIGVGSFDPRFHVRETTELLAEDLGRDRVRYQGNWIPHELRRATEGGVFFAGDSAGHCLPLTAEGIRTALYFGIALGRELRERRRGTPGPRAGGRPLRRVPRLPRVEVPLDAARAAARAAHPAAPARPDDPPAGLEALRRLVVRATTCGSRRRAAGSAHDQDGAGEQQGDADDALGAERDLVEAEQA